MESRNFVVRPRRRRRWFFPSIIVGFLVLIALAPTILSKTSLLDRGIAWAMPPLDGRITYGSIRASWFSSLKIKNVTVLDLDNEVLLTADEIATEHSLLRLIASRQHLGLIRVVAPQCFLRLTDSSSNIEELLAALAVEEDDDASDYGSTGMHLQVDNGLLDISDEASNRSWQFSQLSVDCDMPAVTTQPIAGTVAANVTDGSAAGRLSGQFQITFPDDIASDESPQSALSQYVGSGQIQLDMDQFPLEILNAGLRRSQTQGHVTGYCQAKLDCQWNNVNGQIGASANGNMNAVSTQLSLPEYLGTDKIALESAQVILDGGVDGNLVTIRSLQLTTDHGNVSFSGAAPLSEITATDLVTTLLSSETQNRYELSGQLDLAGLLAALPSTLRVRDGTTVTSGDLQFDVTSELATGQRHINGTLDTQSLAATRNGQLFQWQKPIRINVSGVANEQGLMIEQASCESDFLTAQASGQLDQGSLRTSADLSRLGAELGQFFDLQGKQFAGNMNANVDWQRVDASSVECRANLELSDFSYVTPQQPAWTERLLTIVVAATLDVDNYSVRGAHAGEVSITSDADQLTATLTQPVSDLASLAFPLKITLAGDVKNWLTRARPWYQADTWTLAGSVDAEVKGSFSPQAVNLEQAQANVRNLEFTHPSLHAVESVAQLQGVASWDGQTSSLSSAWFTVTGTTLALRGENVEVLANGEALTASGQAAFRSDLARLYSWFQDPTLQPTTRTRGLAEGRVQVRTEGEAVGVRLNSTVRDFVYEQASNASAQAHQPTGWDTVWQEPTLQVTTDAQYNSAADEVAFENLQIVGESIQVDATGKLTTLSASPQADLAGQLSYDLQRIVTQLGLGQDIQLHGRQSHPFTISGPLSTAGVQVGQPVASASPSPGPTVMGTQPTVIPPDLTARATLGWDGASFYGVPLGPGQLTAQLSEGVVVASPLALQLGAGQVRVAPTLHLNTNPMMLALEQGPLAQGVEISPQMCASWLKYVTPLLANAATARGRFSVDLTGAHVPVSDPRTASVGGRLTIHEARIQPGQLAGQIGALADQVTQLIGEKNRRLDFLQADQSWMDIRENSVDFQMSQGRVYHRNLSVNLGKVPIRTEGWVGLDQTMSMVATIPFLDDWINGEPLLAGLRGQELSIPIYGTFNEPRVDKQAITQFTQQMVGGAAQNYLQGELQKGLQKLLKGR